MSCLCVYTDCNLLVTAGLYLEEFVRQMFLRLHVVLSVQMLGLRWHSLTDPVLGCHASCLPLASGYFCVDPSLKHSLPHVGHYT